MLRGLLNIESYAFEVIQKLCNGLVTVNNTVFFYRPYVDLREEPWSLCKLVLFLILSYKLVLAKTCILIDNFVDVFVFGVLLGISCLEHRESINKY